MASSVAGNGWARPRGRAAPTAPAGSPAPGTHLCAFPRSTGRGVGIAAGFIRAGLADGDRVMYVTGGDGPRGVLTTLERWHVEPGPHLASGQLVLSSVEETYGVPGASADLSALASGFRSAAEQAYDGGFAGLRVVAEMDDVVPILGSFDCVVDWEDAATRLQAEIGVTSVCVYDERRLPASQAARIGSVHAAVVSGDWPNPLAACDVTTDPPGLRLHGELDDSTRGQVVRALRAQLRVHARVWLDLTDVTFLDVSALRGLVAAAAETLPHGAVTITGAPWPVRRTLALAGLGHPRLHIQA